MSTESVLDGEAPRPATLAALPNTPRALVALARRELWEHRSLWILPLVVTGLLLLAAIPAHVDVNGIGMIAATSQRQQAVFMLAQFVLAVPFYLVLLFAVPLYLLDCLYAERRDRSILFWKSLPVSDGLTVLSKLLVGLVVVPLGVYLLALVTHLLIMAIWGVRVLVHTAPAGVLHFNLQAWATLQLDMLLALLLAVLWYAPVVGLLLLISAAARRIPLLWATLPPLLAPLLERIAFGTTYLWHFLGYRALGIWGDVAGGAVAWAESQHNETSLQLVDHLNFGGAFANIDVWLGVLAAALFVYGAVRVRRYRDDT
jgi:ABC-2 type transport system permease protein